MIEDFLRFPEAQEFLSDYPKTKWRACIESVFVYGLYSIKRDFPNGLSIPELMQIAGNDNLKFKPTGFINPEPKQTNIRRNEETQTLIRSPKQQFTEEDVRRVKTSPSQNFSYSNKSFNQSRDYVGDAKGSEFSVSGRIKEPKICSIENAKKIMKKVPDEGRGGKKERNYVFDFNVEYLPKTIPTELYQREKNLLMSPKFYL